MKLDMGGERPRLLYKLFYIDSSGDLITPMVENRNVAYTFMSLKLSQGYACWIKECQWVEGTDDQLTYWVSWIYFFG